ncbi:MAG: glucose-6-phosphate isomerase family protein [bacterium]|nr:glucose-6-phosphate isomerase family protein [bacterium]
MLDVLMDPKSLSPDVHYFMIRGGSEKKNITVWESGTVGDEYIKTYGHYHVSDFLETYEVIAGVGVFLLQVRKTNELGQPIDDEIEYIKAIFVKEGSIVEIPPRTGHLAVNIGESWLVTKDNSPVNKEKAKEAAWPTHADYAPVKNLHGFAYYVVKQNNTPAFVKNPNYKNTPEIIIEK